METPWLDRNEYPFTSNFLTIDGHRYHYIDEGNGPVLLFVHGTPSWSFDFRHVITALKDQFRCIAIDHIGFGLSDKPTQYPYTLQHHAKNLEVLIWHLQLTEITLVAHDFGGPIGAHVLLNHPQRFVQTVFINTWLWSAETEPEFRKMKRLLNNPLLPFMYRVFNFSPRYVMPQSFGDKKLSEHIHQHYIKPFSNKKERNGPVGFIHSLLYDQHWFEAIWENRKAISDKPILIIWGKKDPVIKPVYLEKFKSGFPNARVLQLASSGHFPQEEEPHVVADTIRTFMLT